MSNHVHLLVTPSEPGGLSRTMQSMGRRYVRYFNQMYRRSGTLWEGCVKSCVIDAEAYLLLCQRYIELNPAHAGMVEHPGEYRWSSYAANGQAKPEVTDGQHAGSRKNKAHTGRSRYNWTKIC